jgi:phytoene/squalene synthetase
MNLFNNTAKDISRLVTRNYSTSFYTASSLLAKEIREAIFSIYGFVRFSDEIVDTFHEYNKKNLIEKFEKDYYDAVKDGISLNPILNSFQETVQKYGIPDEYVQAFLSSMKNDLEKKDYGNRSEMNEYIYGSADVVGLMCLRVFCNGNDDLFNELEKPAMKLGSAFQKVNFLRDLKNDMENLDRSYFPDINREVFSEEVKSRIVGDIEDDFREALEGIRRLPSSSRLAVAVAFYYYRSLLRKIKSRSADDIIARRIRISNFKKILLLIKTWLLVKLRVF